MYVCISVCSNLGMYVRKHAQLPRRVYVRAASLAPIHHPDLWPRPDSAEPRMASAVEIGVAVAATLVVLVVANRAYALLRSLLEGRVELLTWEDRMEDLPGGDDGE